MEQSNEVILYEDDDVKVGAEVVDGLLFCHCYAKTNMSKSVLKKWRRWWGILKEEALLAGFNDVFTYTPNLHFCKLLDNSFEHIKTIDSPNGPLEVLKWELTQFPSQ